MQSRRLEKELNELKEMFRVVDACHRYDVWLPGPPDTPYSGGMFRVSIITTARYPFDPPQVTFVTRMLHPNICATSGNVCLDVISERSWSPAYTLRTVILSIQALLANPNPSDPLNEDAALLADGSPEEYERIVKQWVEKYSEEAE
tara:strand:- start:119 stop:556 length:438 start_codon:yes stop_codon:yes gene_type:complete